MHLFGEKPTAIKTIVLTVRFYPLGRLFTSESRNSRIVIWVRTKIPGRHVKLLSRVAKVKSIKAMNLQQWQQRIRWH
jgi:hypothetical protein